MISFLTALLQNIKDFFITGFWSLLIVIAIFRAYLTRLYLDLKANGWLTYLDYVPSFRVWLLIGTSLLAIILGRRAVKWRVEAQSSQAQQASRSKKTSGTGSKEKPRK